MSIPLTIAALQELHATIPGITSTPTAYPSSIDASMLPLILVWPYEGSWKRAGGSAPMNQNRTYSVQVFVSPVAGGASIDDTIQACITLLNALGEKYTDPCNISLTNQPYQSTIQMGEGDITDGGIGVITYGGTDYSGFQFKIKINEKAFY